eukprot:94894_1
MATEAKDTDSKEENMSVTDHILRNYGNDVASLKNGTHVSKGPTRPNEMLREDWTKYDGHNGFTHVPNNSTIQVNFRMKYKLNTIKFLLWDGDDREYDYKIEISNDGKAWNQLCKLSNRKSWQEIIFNTKLIKHVRIIGIGGSSHCSNAIHIVKFMAYFDYSL